MTNNELAYNTRPLQVKLSNNQLYVASKLESKDSLSQGAQLTLSITANDEIDSNVLGQNISVSYKQQNDTRTFLGLVTSIELKSYNIEKSLYFYEVEARDPLSLLHFRMNRQVFQNMTTMQILKSLFGNSNFSSFFEFSVTGSGRKHDYCIQLDESDLSFAQRLLAEEGWHYHLDHSGNKPVIIIGDSNHAFASIDGGKLFFRGGSQSNDHQLSNWKIKNSIGTAKLTLADHNQELAEVFDTGERKSSHRDSPQSLSSYYYGQGFDDKGDLRNVVKRQMEALDNSKVQASATSTINDLSCGAKFKLDKHPVSSLNQEYLITDIVHRIMADESGRNVSYENSFQCCDVKTPFRPPYIHYPAAQQLHTATVTGPKNEEIYRDKYGRIKIQFHWDLAGKGDENTSCWIPVSQGVASKGFGVLFLPRVGDEVLIQYIDGNPNRPVVIGSIYNKTNSPAYSSASQSGIKTRTTPKGSSKQGNELRFEDQKDKEHIYLHAEKDLLIDSNNDLTTTVKGKVTSTIEKSSELIAKENISATTDKQLIMHSKEDLSAKSDKNVNLESGANSELKAKSSVIVDGSKISISGKSKIELKVGASKIEISASGIKLDAPTISINGKGKAEMKASMVNIEGKGKTDVKGTLVTVNGSAMTEVKAGAMVKIQGAIAKVN
ncbi:MULTISPECIES: type VI secretion system Vgr family protein [Vibrio]|uniref:Type IV secretion protein Rhs n=1 Tax=Vibrio genomosp. F6 str. FF-238 TaxID=1191298 RepID=A0A1E5D3K1_9VIBR|nr:MULTISPECIES: type VI secretion system tip protein TssI/VgrG [Vibrio]NOH85827.1 type VI secretion system tip protein VgrG [Vibrio sp. 03-59-1]OEE78106.1 type IV secretion protein Rhs [Vibrio genomosp. F6 str. FF-238]